MIDPGHLRGVHYVQHLRCCFRGVIVFRGLQPPAIVVDSLLESGHFYEIRMSENGHGEFRLF